MKKVMVLAVLVLVLGGCATRGQRVVFVPVNNTSVAPTTVVVEEPQQRQIVYAPTSSGYYQRDGYRHNSYGVDDLVRLGNQAKREENRHEESMTRIKVQALNNAGHQLRGAIKEYQEDRKPSYQAPRPRHDRGRQSDQQSSRSPSPRRRN